jgi:inorganic triphosphatase YgiF
MVRHDDALIELAIDRGEVVAADRIAPIVEIELELKEGTPASLFAFARCLDGMGPVRPGVLSKSERGYRLLDEKRTAFKAEPVVLAETMTAAEAFQRIVHLCVRQFRLNEAMLSSGRHADALHQARVALRRLRSAFSIFQAIARGPEADRLKAALRDLAAELGEARNLDVLLDRADVGRLRDRISAARDQAYGHVEAALAASSTRALMLDLLEWTTASDWLDDPDTRADRQRTVRAHAEAALDRFRRKVKKDGRDLAHASDETRHEVRKDAKKLRYAAEFFRSLFVRKRERRRYKRFVAALEELQDQLGALNDLATAPDILKALDLDEVLDRHWHGGSGKAHLIEAADEAHEELVDSKRFWR